MTRTNSQSRSGFLTTLTRLSRHTSPLPTCCANAAFPTPTRGPRIAAPIIHRKALSRETGRYKSAKVRAGASALIADPFKGPLRNRKPRPTSFQSRQYQASLVLSPFGIGCTRSTGMRGDKDRSTYSQLVACVLPHGVKARGRANPTVPLPLALLSVVVGSFQHSPCCKPNPDKTHDVSSLHVVVSQAQQSMEVEHAGCLNQTILMSETMTP